MLRQATAATLVCALQVGASWAPWVHAHLDEHADGHHHHGQVVHAHLSAHGTASHHRHAPTPAVGDADAERAIAVQLFVAVEPVPPPVLAVAGTAVELPAPPVHMAVAPVRVTSGHDPPAATALVPRAPPLLTRS